MWKLVSFNDHNAFRLNVSSTLVLPKQRDRSTKFNVPFCHSNKGKSCYFRYQRIRACNTDIPENLKTLASYILFWGRYIYWKPTCNIIYFNSYSILREMYKKTYFLFFQDIWDKYQDIGIIYMYIYLYIYIYIREVSRTLANI